MRRRLTDSPVGGVLLAATYCCIALLVGVGMGQKLRECPAATPDGRELLGINLRTNECRYRPQPRPALNYSPEELRRMATMRSRMERTRP